MISKYIGRSKEETSKILFINEVLAIKVYQYQ